MSEPKIQIDSGTLAVTLAECRGILRMDEEEAGDEELTLIVESAIRRVEDDTSLSLINKTWVHYLASFYPGRSDDDDFWYEKRPTSIRRGGLAIEVPRSPLVSVSSLKYWNMSGVQTTIDPSQYQLDTHSEPGRIAPISASVSWPAGVNSIDYLNPIELIFVAGFGDSPADVPFRLRHAIIMLAGHFWEHPEATLEGASSLRDVQGYKETIRHYKARNF